MALESEEEYVWSEEEQSAQGSRHLHTARLLPILFVITLFGLIGIGLPMVHSSTVYNYGSSLFTNQVRWLIIGIGTAFFTVLIPMRLIIRYSFWAVAAVGVLLGYLAIASISNKIYPDSVKLFPMVSEIKGAVRWLRIPAGPLTLQMQPSELAKVALILFLSSYYGMLERLKIKQFLHGIVIPGGTAGVILMLILLGKDLSTTVITGASCFAIMFFAGAKLRYLITIGLIGVAVGSMAIYLSPERVSRITSYKNPEAEKGGDAYQLWRSQLGMGGGGFMGRGFSKGVLKTYLPEAHTDFIVAVIGEEFGFIGVSMVFFLYLVMFASVFGIARQCRRRPEMLMCMGIGTLICFQALINIGVVSGWCPTTGVTAPFLSYGGSSMLILLVCCGIILNISMRNLVDIWEEINNTRWDLTYKTAALKRQ